MCHRIGGRTVDVKTKSGKKPLYKKWWFIVIVAFFALSALGSMVSGTSPSERVDKELEKQSKTPESTTETPQTAQTSPSSEHADKSTVNSESAPQEKATTDEGKAIEVALKEFGCKKEELSVEQLSSKTFLVSWVTNAGGGLSTIDSVLIVKDKIKAQLSKDPDTYNEKVGKERGETTETTENIVNPMDVKWDTSNMDVWETDNMAKAAEVLNKMTAYEMSQVPLVDDDLKTIYKAPWKYFGKFVSITGNVTGVSVSAPGSDFSNTVANGGTCTEVQITTDDVIGVTFLLIGDGSDIQSGSPLTIYGLPVGYLHGTNQYGGQVSHLVIVGAKK